METKQLITFCIIEKGESNSDYKKHYDEIINLLRRGETNLDAIYEIKKIADGSVYPYANDAERLKYILEEIGISEKGGKK